MAVGRLTSPLDPNAGLNWLSTDIPANGSHDVPGTGSRSMFIFPLELSWRYSPPSAQFPPRNIQGVSSLQQSGTRKETSNHPAHALPWQ